MQPSPKRRKTDRQSNVTVYYRMTILGSIVILILIGGAVIVALAFSHPTSDQTPLAVTLLGFVATTLVSLLALLKTEKVQHHVDTAINGVINNGNSDTENEGS